MYISTGTLIIAAFVCIYYIRRYYIMNKLRNTMNHLQNEKEMLYYRLQNYTKNRDLLYSGIESIFPLYISHTNKEYAKLGSPKGDGPQNLYEINKCKLVESFTYITLFQFVSTYIDKNRYSLVEYRDGVKCKTEFCKELEEICSCTAKYCLELESVDSRAAAFLHNAEKYANSNYYD